MTPGQITEYLLGKGLQASLFIAENNRTYIQSAAAKMPFLMDFGVIDEDKIGQFQFVSFHVAFDDCDWDLSKTNVWLSNNRWLKLWLEDGNLFAQLDILLDQDHLTEHLLIQHLLLWENALNRLLVELPGYV